MRDDYWPPTDRDLGRDFYVEGYRWAEEGNERDACPFKFRGENANEIRALWLEGYNDCVAERAERLKQAVQRL